MLYNIPMIHKTIKDQTIEALRAKDTLKLETLRGLSAQFMNEIIASGLGQELLPDDKALAVIRRSVKQRKDSIEQFEKGGRADLAEKERAELKILEQFLPAMMSESDINAFVKMRIDEQKSSGSFDPKAGGKLVGTMMKELAGKADGALVKKAVEEALRS